MRIRIAHDETTIAGRWQALGETLESVLGSVTVDPRPRPAVITGEVVRFPESYFAVQPSAEELVDRVDLTIIATRKPYDNNYFFEAIGLAEKKVLSICSFFDWESLTNLPIENGYTYFLARHLVGQVVDADNHQATTGCINDFWRDKTAVDSGMRSAYLCPACLASRRLGGTGYEDVQIMLDAVSMSSRLNSNVIDYLRTDLERSGGTFDVFLCHNSRDKASIREIRDQLRSRSIRTWMDEDELRPGQLWQVGLEEAIASIRSAAVFVGESGTGPWQDLEIRAFLSEFVSRGCPVIPVILPSATRVPELPLFLKQMMWVDFRDNTKDPLSALVWGITGNK